MGDLNQCNISDTDSSVMMEDFGKDMVFDAVEESLSSGSEDGEDDDGDNEEEEEEGEDNFFSSDDCSSEQDA